MAYSMDSMEQIFNHIPVVKEISKNYVSIEDFAERTGITPQTIRKKIRAGAIEPRHMVNMPRGVRDKIYIDWDVVVYDFLLYTDERFRPADFVINEDKEYKPILSKSDRKEPPRVVVTKEDGPQPGEGDMIERPVVDLNSAKYRKAQLDVEKLTMENMVMKNELIKIDEVEALFKQLGAELKAEMQKFVTKVNPSVTTCMDLKQNKKTLETGLKKVLDKLQNAKDRKEEKD